MNLPGNEVFIRKANNYISDAQRLQMGAKLHPTEATIFAKIGVALTSNRRRLLVAPTIIDNNMMSATPKDLEVTSRFLYFLMTSLDFNPISAGTALPYLNVSDLQQVKVSVPDIETQKKIECLLGALDDRIALLRETNTTLEAIAQALFKSWFVDFDPVRAKQQGRVPTATDEDIAALFAATFQESEIGSVPSGWRVATLGEVVKTVGGATPDTKEPTFWVPGQYAWTTPKDLSGIASPVLWKTERRLSEKGIAKIGSGLLPAGTLLLSSRAPIGYLALAQVPLAINQGYIAMLPHGFLPPVFMLCWCKHHMDVIKARSNGSTFMEISKAAFRPIPVLVPPAPLIERFVQVAEFVFARIAQNELQAQTLATLRDTLLPRLISGRLRIPEAEALP